MYANFTDTPREPIKHTSPHITYNLTNLSKCLITHCFKTKQINHCGNISEPFTEYKIWVKAYTGKNEGEQSDPVINTTDISGPSPPRILNLTCQTQDTIFLQWARPDHYFYSIDYYYIYIYLDERLWKNLTLEASKEHLDTSVSISLISILYLTSRSVLSRLSNFIL